jgi:dienelactone hydrolase
VRQLVEINTSDGRLLEGFYYPAGVEKAPVIVLMHWAPGTMADWDHIAVWLQNRPAEADTPPVAKGTFHDPGWFPAMPEEVSFAVLVFNFGKYGSSQYGGSRASYVLDAEAALQHAASLPGVDTHRMTAIGASIGADGVADACYLFNDLGEKGTCVGAFSLSPGNYLTDEFSYPFAVEMVNLSGFPVWCLAAEKDGRSPELCRAIVGPLNQSFIFPGSHHGMELLDPELLPSEPAVGLNALELLQEFLEQAYGIELNNFNLP